MYYIKCNGVIINNAESIEEARDVAHDELSEMVKIAEDESFGAFLRVDIEDEQNKLIDYIESTAKR